MTEKFNRIRVRKFERKFSLVSMGDEDLFIITLSPGDRNLFKWTSKNF